MAYISFQPSDFFSTKLYSGTSATHAVTGVGFQPDVVWLKQRTLPTTYHYMNDAVRGADNQIYTNENSANATNAYILTAFGADGFTLSTNSEINNTGEDYVSWNWKMGTTSGLSGGTITPTAYSISTTAGQSIIAYTGTGSAATIPHGLGVAPRMVIVKRLNSSDNWTVGHQNMKDVSPWDWAIKLNTTATPADDATNWNDTAPTATVFSIGTSTEVNTNTSTYIAYCFADIKGYSKFGGYIGNGNADGPFIYTGFRPAFVVAKKSSTGTGSWRMIDNKRNSYNGQFSTLEANTVNAQYAGSDDFGNTDLLSNGFKLRDDYEQVNGSGLSYIYMAFAAFPFVSSNSKAGTAR